MSFFDRAVTIGDVLLVMGLGALFLILLAILAIVAVNEGWVR